VDFVVDASVSLTWCFEDQATAYGEAVLDRFVQSGAVVPGIWTLEIANALVVGERRRRLSEAQTTRFIGLLGELPIEVDEFDLDTAFGPVLAIARAHRLSAYDAAYLELAARRGLPIATLDSALVEAAPAAGVPLLI
jgi:predicted nucleic acid-binding protein